MENKIFKCSRCGCETTNDKSIKLRDGSIYEIHRCDACQKRWDMEFEWESKGETTRERNIICPYCGYEYSDYGGYEFDSGDHDEVECEDCGMHFDLEVRETRTYSTKRSLCDMPEDFDPEED